MHTKERQYHVILAEYFMTQPLFFEGNLEHPNEHKCVELVFQLVRSEMCNELESVLTDILFIQAKCMVGLSTEVVEDYKEALYGVSESGKECIKAFNHIYKLELHHIRYNIPADVQ